jgi:hypothetical protein
MATGRKTKKECALEEELKIAAQDSSVIMVRFTLTYSWSLSSKWRLNFKTHILSWKEQKYGLRS